MIKMPYRKWVIDRREERRQAHGEGVKDREKGQEDFGNNYFRPHNGFIPQLLPKPRHTCYEASFSPSSFAKKCVWNFRNLGESRGERKKREHSDKVLS